MAELERIAEGDDDEADPDNDYVPPIENGYTTESSNSSSRDENSSDDEVAAGNIEEKFDTNLPTTHKYLGKLNDVSGYTLYDDGEILKILSIYTNTLVFPGFTLPLVMNNQSEKHIMQSFIENNKVFVLLFANASHTGIFKFGVTMEIIETQVRNNILHIKARGRQRCKLVPRAKVNNLFGRLQYVTVKVLAEPPIVSPIADTQMLNLKSKRPHTSSNYNEITKNHKFRRYHLAQYPFPGWIYDKYEVSFYTKLLLEGLLGYIDGYIPNDPEKLSYWFVQNYQLSHFERLNILQLNTTLERLRLEYKYLKMERKIRCLHCGSDITDHSKVFAMSKDGTQGNYVNPAGHIYETLTVLVAKNYQLIGKPSEEFSWFPGNHRITRFGGKEERCVLNEAPYARYPEDISVFWAWARIRVIQEEEALFKEGILNFKLRQKDHIIMDPEMLRSRDTSYSWTIIQCITCHYHLGWRFSSRTLRPRHFYGLAKSGLNVIPIRNIERDSLEPGEGYYAGKKTYAPDYILLW